MLVVAVKYWEQEVSFYLMFKSSLLLFSFVLWEFLGRPGYLRYDLWKSFSAFLSLPSETRRLEGAGVSQ